MAVYVDKSQRRFRRMITCHMLADTLEELHAMAEAIGCSRGWYQISRTGVPHYDIPKERRAHALELGALEIGIRETAAVMARTRLPEYRKEAE